MKPLHRGMEPLHRGLKPSHNRMEPGTWGKEHFHREMNSLFSGLIKTQETCVQCGSAIGLSPIVIYLL